MKYTKKIEINIPDGVSDETAAGFLRETADSIEGMKMENCSFIPHTMEGWTDVGYGRGGGLTPDGLISDDLAELYGGKWRYGAYYGVNLNSRYAVRNNTELSKHLGVDDGPPYHTPKPGDVYDYEGNGKPSYLCTDKGFVNIDHADTGRTISAGGHRHKGLMDGKKRGGAFLPCQYLGRIDKLLKKN